MTSPAERVERLIKERVEKEVAKAVAEKNGTEDLPKLVGEILESRLEELSSRTRNRSTQTDTEDDPIDWKELTERKGTIELDIFGTRSGRKQFLRRKSVLSQTSITSSPTAITPIWSKPTLWGWCRELGRVMNVGPSSTVKFNELGGIAIENRTSEKTQRSYGGTLNTVSKVLKNYETTGQFANNVLSDIGDGFYNEMAGLMTGLLDEQLNSDAITEIKTSVASSDKGSSASVTTGKTGTNLTAENVVSKLGTLLTKVDSKYWNRERSQCVFLVSEDIYTLLLNATSGEKGEFAMRPLQDSLTLFGFRVEPTTQLDGGTTDGDLKCIFLNGYRSIGLAVREGFMIEPFPEVEPKTQIYIGQTRIVVNLYDPESAAGIVVGA